MANKKFWLGTLVIVLTLGMTVAGCSKGSKADSNQAESDGEKAAGGGTTTAKTGGGTTDGGRTWTAVDVRRVFDVFDFSIVLLAVTYGNGTFVAGGYGGIIAYSKD